MTYNLCMDLAPPKPYRGFLFVEDIMKDINKLKNYRTKYKRHYGIEFGREYVIHHIDGNRANNDITNLLLLPIELHSKYHTYKEMFEFSIKDGMSLNLSYFGSCLLEAQLHYLDDLVEVIRDIQVWIEYKFLADKGYEIYPMFEKREKNGNRKNK